MLHTQTYSYLTVYTINWVLLVLHIWTDVQLWSFGIWRLICEAGSGRNWFTLFRYFWPPRLVHLGVASCGATPIHFAKSTAAVIVQIVRRYTYCWKFMGAFSLEGLERKIWQYMSWPSLTLKIFILSLLRFKGSLTFKYDDCIPDSSTEGGHHANTCSLHFKNVWITVVVSIRCKDWLLWWEMEILSNTYAYMWVYVYGGYMGKCWEYS